MKIIDSYRTIDSLSKGEYKEKGSKFIAYAFEINSEEEFKIHLDDIKKEHFKARHHCYAYALGTSHEIYRYNDDGEPGGTAGLPIYNQIKSYNLSNIGIVVVRYFGGTKLGVPGLIRAYKTSSIDALESGSIVTRLIVDKIKIEYDYNYMGNIMRIVNQFDVKVLENTFDKLPGLVIEIRKSKTAIFIKTIYSAILNRDIKDIKDNEKIEGLKIKIC